MIMPMHSLIDSQHSLMGFLQDGLVFRMPGVEPGRLLQYARDAEPDIGDENVVTLPRKIAGEIAGDRAKAEALLNTAFILAGLRDPEDRRKPPTPSRSSGPGR